MLAVGVLAVDYEEEEEEGEEPYIELVEVWGSMVVKAGVPQLSSIPLSICRTYSIRKKIAPARKIAPLFIGTSLWYREIFKHFF